MQLVPISNCEIILARKLPRASVWICANPIIVNARKGDVVKIRTIMKEASKIIQNFFHLT